MPYAAAELNSALSGRISRLNGGSLQLLAADGTTVIATVPFDSPCGTVSGNVLTFSGFPKTVTPAVFGTAIASARVRNSSNADVLTGITVGTTGAQINMSKLTPATGDTITVGATCTLTDS